MTATTAPARVDDIPGWFHWLDRRMFNAVLASQVEFPSGHLVELGCYLGKSAVVVGRHQRPGETFFVVDLFGDESLLDESSEASANRQETAHSYATLNRSGFEANYLRFHPDLPEIIQGPSSHIVRYLEPASARFIHVDASHLYPQVREDARNAAKLLAPGGAVVFDDYRAEHTPGVAAAVWQAVVNEGLIPFAITSRKLYGCYSGQDHYLSAIEAFGAQQADVKLVEENVAGHRILRLRPRSGPAKVPTDSTQQIAREVSQQVLAGLQPELESLRSSVAKLAKRQRTAPPAPAKALLRDLTPPLVARWWRSHRS